MMVVGNEEDGIKDEAQVSDVLFSDLENVEESADDDFHVGCGMFGGLVRLCSGGCGMWLDSGPGARG